MVYKKSFFCRPPCRRRRPRREKGYSLLELMVVVAILAIITAIAIPNFLEARDRATWSLAVANLRAVQSALAYYHARALDESYPVEAVGTYHALRDLLAEARLPEEARQAGWEPAPVTYTPSPDHQSYTVLVRINVRHSVPAVLTPDGIVPPDFPY